MPKPNDGVTAPRLPLLALQPSALLLTYPPVGIVIIAIKVKTFKPRAALGLISSLKSVKWDSFVGVGLFSFC